MWTCHKCGKPVYFAERQQSLGFDWHPECLRCEECGKRLSPGQHAEHKGVPYCHVPCYGALFGPQLFGHGTRVESHKSYGVRNTERIGALNSGPILPRDHLESKLKVYNQFYDNKSLEVRSREVNNRLILEGALRVYWGVQGVIHLKEDDDQRTFIVRKRNSCRVSKAVEDSVSDKENEVSESFEPQTTASDIEGLSTDVTLSESITYDSCSLNEISELPTTPEDASANTATGSCVDPLITNGSTTSAVDDETTTSDSSRTLVDANVLHNVNTSNSNSCSLPSKLDKFDKLQWDEIDDLLRVERQHSEKDNNYETMPVRLPSTTHSSNESSPTNSASAQDSLNVNYNCTPLSSCSQNNSSTPTSPSLSMTVTSSDNFLTASASVTQDTSQDQTTTSATTNFGDYETCDDVTLKPVDFEEFKRSVHQDYVNGANSFQEHSDDTLKRNQPIDPSRIHDSLKLYGNNSVMSKSFNCETALRSVNSNIHDTSAYGYLRHSTNRPNNFQKSGSTSIVIGALQQKNSGLQAKLQLEPLEKGINRSKSGPSCFAYSDSEDDINEDTLKPQKNATVRRSDVPPRYLQLQTNSSSKQGGNSEYESSRADESSTVNSAAMGGDELTQSEGVFTANDSAVTESGEQRLHVTEDGVVLRRPPRTGASAIKRRSGNRRSRTKLKRRCSINGHFYNRETSFFTPPYGSQMSVWVTSMVTTRDVINLVLEKYKVDSSPENFSLFVMHDNGEQKRLKENDYPLVTRVMIGPHEDVARLFLVDSRKTDEISNEVAQFLNLSLPECRAILERYDQELEREVTKVKEKYSELRRRIVSRMESLKVHL